MRLEFPNVVGNLEVYMDVMRAICGNTENKSMIDLGCSFAPHTPKLGFSRRMYIDINYQPLRHKDEQQFFIQKNILDVDTDMHYDVAIASDVIEHLTPTDGFRLIKIMEQISDKQIFFTPLTDIFGLVDLSNKDPEAHRSLWAPEDFKGYAALVFPNYHKVWNGGAFFAFRVQYGGDDMTDLLFERVEKILNEKQWSRT